MLKRRASGLLLHITSLPGGFGIGDLGPQAYKFADFLKDSGQKYWQILPLNHTTAKTGYSPYNCSSAFAGNPLLLSPQLLYQQGLLKKSEIKDVPSFPKKNVDYGKVLSYKNSLFELVFERFKKDDAYEQFVKENFYWLDDFATFISLHRLFKNQSWYKWPRYARDRKGKEFEKLKTELKLELEYRFVLQYLFFRQWEALKKYCNERDIEIMGDIPIYVVYDSPDVWANPGLFKLNRSKKPKFIAGVPPDYFSRTGQLWGNPIYDWRAIKKTKYKWWMERIRHNMKLFDLVRIDHFRGLVGYWQVPAGHKTAIKGKWLEGPGEEFFETMYKRLPNADIFAEDLGYITDDVREVIAKFELPTMRVLHFAFDGDPAGNPHIPHNHVKNCIVYTGTHDNNTTRGWYKSDADRQHKKRLNEYLGFKVSAKNVHWHLIHLAMSSVANLSVIPIQDILGLPESARMNHPARKKGNWLWRMEPGKFDNRLAGQLRRLGETYARI